MSQVVSRASARRRRWAVTWAPWRLGIKRAAKVARNASVSFAVPLLLLAAWALASERGWLAYQILPPPAQIWATFRDTAANGDLLTNTLISLRRVLLGFALGASAGAAIGIAIGLSRRLYFILDPLLTFVAQIPPLGWIPLLMLCVGVDESLKVTVVAYATAIPVFINVAQGVRDVPPPLRELGRALTFDLWTTLTRIVLPAAVPSIFTGLREGLANAWQSMVAAEIFASTEGLGYAVGLGRQLFQADLVIAMIVVLGITGLALNGGFRLLELRLLQWQVHRP